MATPSLSENVEDIMDSLDDLEAVLEPLLTLGPLADTLGKLGILERAKLQAMLAYVTQDLVFSMQHINSVLCNLHADIVYLKTQGVDPTKHPVMQQLVRSLSNAVRLITYSCSDRNRQILPQNQRG